MSNMIDLTNYFKLSDEFIRQVWYDQHGVTAKRNDELSYGSRWSGDAPKEGLFGTGFPEHLNTVLTMLTEDFNSFGNHAPETQYVERTAAYLQSEKIDISRLIDNVAITIGSWYVVRNQNPHYPSNYLGYININHLYEALFSRMDIQDYSLGREYYMYQARTSWLFDQLDAKVELFNHGPSSIVGYIRTKPLATFFKGTATLNVTLRN